MRKFSIIILTIVLLLSNFAAADTYTWIGPGPAWDNAANWTGGATYPQANTDKAIFASSATADCESNSATTIGELEIQSGYMGTITFNSNLTITDTGGQSGNFTQNDGTVTFNGNALSISGDCNVASGSLGMNSNTSTLDVGGNLAISGTMGSPTWTGNATLGSLTVESGGAFYATSGTTTVNSYNTNDNFILKVSNTSTFAHDNGTITITTDANYKTIDMGYGGTKKQVYNLVINSPTASNIIYYRGSTGLTEITNDLTITSGHLQTANNSESFDVAGNIIVGANGTLGHSAWDVSNVSFGTLSVESGGTFYATSGTTTITSESAGGFAFLVSSGGTFTHNSGTLTITTPATTQIAVATGSGNYYNVVYNSAGNTLNIAESQFDVDNDLTITAGTARMGSDSQTMVVTGDVLVSNTGTLGHSTWTGSNVSFGTLSVESGGTFYATSGTTTITSQNANHNSINLNSASNIFPNNGTIKLTGSNYSYFELGDKVYNFEVAVAGSVEAIFGRYTNSTEIKGDLTITSTRAFKGYNDVDALTVDGDVNVVSGVFGSDIWSAAVSFGSLTLNSGTTFKATSGTTEINGNWTDNGTFEDDNGTVSAIDMTITAAGPKSNAFNNLLVDTGNTIRVEDGVTAYYSGTFTNNGTWDQSGGYGGAIESSAAWQTSSLQQTAYGNYAISKNYSEDWSLNNSGDTTTGNYDISKAWDEKFSSNDLVVLTIGNYLTGESQTVSGIDLGLTAGDILPSDTSPSEGDTIDINVTIHNWGDTDSGQFTSALYLDSAIPGNGLTTETMSISAGGTQTMTTEWDTSGQLGQHTLIGVADTESAITEANEENNSANKQVDVVSPNTTSTSEFRSNFESANPDAVFTIYNASDEVYESSDLYDNQQYSFDFEMSSSNAQIRLFYPPSADLTKTPTVTDDEENENFGFGTDITDWLDGLGYEAKDFAWVNLNGMISSENFTARIELPSTYDMTYYCHGTDPVSCETIETYSEDSSQAPCYYEADGKTYIYTEGYSGAGGASAPTGSSSGSPVTPAIFAFDIIIIVFVAGIIYVVVRSIKKEKTEHTYKKKTTKHKTTKKKITKTKKTVKRR